MITFNEDGPDFEPDDPLAVIMRPPSERLAPPPGRYEEIRRGAARRRVLRAAVGAGATCAVAALLAVPLLRTTHQAPASPTVPLAPPPVSSPKALPTPSDSASAGVTPRPSARPRGGATAVPGRHPATSASPSATGVPIPTQPQTPVPTAPSRTAQPSTDPSARSASASVPGTRPRA
ncbi:hypothetical protein [Streptomyces sp. NPDC006739]|uniref:hypothetical protein n=1 Tax=Streptomyces sp. NPDC006739 TaxID=3364763 RepID=UPI0036B2EDEA